MQHNCQAVYLFVQCKIYNFAETRPKATLTLFDNEQLNERLWSWTVSRHVTLGLLRIEQGQQISVMRGTKVTFAKCLIAADARSIASGQAGTVS